MGTHRTLLPSPLLRVSGLPPSYSSLWELGRGGTSWLRLGRGCGICACAGLKESRLFITLPPLLGRRDSRVWNRRWLLTSPQDGCAPLEQNLPPHCMAGFGVSPDR